MKTEIKLAEQPDTDSFASVMGISSQREEQLCDLIGQCYDSTDTYPHAIVGIAQETDNINELVYSIFHLGAYAGEERAKDNMADFLER